LIQESIPYDSFLYDSGIAEVVLGIILWALVSVHPIAAAIFSEVLLIEEQSLFFTTISLGNFSNFPMISPWIPFCILYILVSLLLYLLSIVIVGRKEK
jgi:hypothetical protein